MCWPIVWFADIPYIEVWKVDKWGRTMFPVRAVETAIRDEIASAINDRPIPRAGWEPEVDSLVMVRVVLRVEEEFVLVLPDDVMPSGGFHTVEHCVATVVETCSKLCKVSQSVKEEV